MPFHNQTVFIRVPAQRPDLTAARMQLLRLVAGLHSLERWEPIGVRLEDVRLALRGAGGLTGAELEQLERLVVRWASLDQRLRDLYLAEIGGKYSRAVRAALWVALGLQTTPRPPGPATYGALRDLWLDRYGYPPPIDLAPLPRRTT